ncbi:MAG: M35 family metallo-endopeptidase [Paracoccaceae bacterium]
MTMSLHPHAHRTCDCAADQEDLSATKAVVLDGFPASPAPTLGKVHRASLARIATALAKANADKPRARCLHLVGHSALWRDMTTEEYARRAAARAYAVAKELEAQLALRNLKAVTLGETALDTVQDGFRCRPRKGVDVSLYVGSRSNSQPLVDNLVKRSDAAARANRALNRRVELRLLRPTPAKPAPGRRDTPDRPGQIGMGCITGAGERYREVRSYAAVTLKATRRARARLAMLAAMPAKKREAAWDAGPERLWFGRYGRANGRVPFAFVERTVVRMLGFFSPDAFFTIHGRAAPDPCSDRRHTLTIECFNPTSRPSDKSIREALLRLDPDESRTPQKTWCSRQPMRPGQRAIEELYVLRDDYETLGFSIPCMRQNVLHPMQRKAEKRPFRIALCPGWFNTPKLKGKSAWQEARRVTIAHELAHLAGANRLLGDVYEAKRAQRLAQRNPWGARINAENYAYYVMSFAPQSAQTGVVAHSPRSRGSTLELKRR